MLLGSKRGPPQICAAGSDGDILLTLSTRMHLDNTLQPQYFYFEFSHSSVPVFLCNSSKYYLRLHLFPSLNEKCLKEQGLCPFFILVLSDIQPSVMFLHKSRGQWRVLPGKCSTSARAKCLKHQGGLVYKIGCSVLRPEDASTEPHK